MKQILLKTWLMLCLFLVVGVGNVWAEDATMTAGTNGSTATVNSKSAIKVGTSNKGGDMTITVPAGATSLDFYAAAWSGVTGLSLNITPAANVSPTSVTLTADTGISGNSPFTLSGTESSYKFTIALSNITEETQIKLTSSTTKRFVVWGATYTAAVDNRTAVNMTGFSATSTTLTKGDNTTTSVTNDQNGWTPAYTYESSNTGVATVSNDGVITAVAKGTARITASLNIANDDATWKKGATASKTIDITVNNPSHTAHFSVNGTIDPAKDASVEEGSAITFPENPQANDVEFIGWTKNAIDGTADNAPSDICTSATMGTEDVTYYAVFAEATTTTFDPNDLTNTPSNGTLSWKNSTTGVQLKLSAGSLYTSGSPKTFSVTAGTDNYFQVTSDNSPISKIVTTVSTTDYKINSVSTGATLTTSSTTQTISCSSTDVKAYAASSKQLRATQIVVTTASDFCTTVKAVTGVAVKTAPTTVTYCEGEKFNPAGLEVTLTYEDETTKDVAYTDATASKFTFTPALNAALTTSDDHVAITINGQTANQTISVRSVSIAAPVVVEGTYTVKVGDAAAVTADGNTINALKGQKIVLASTPAAGYKLHSTPFVVTDEDDENVSVSTANNQYSFTMPGKNVKITTQFTRVYTITAGSCEHGSITAIKDASGNALTETSKGSTVKVEATADTHYHLTGMYYVKENEETQNVINENEGVYSFTMPQSNVTVYATFADDTQYTVSWMVNGAEAKSEQVYADVPVSAPAVDPVAGKVFRGWVAEEIDGTTDDAPSFVNVTNLTVNEDKVFYAVFATVIDGGYGSITITNEDFTNVLSNSYTTKTITKTINGDDYKFELNACEQNSMAQFRDNATLSYLFIPELPGDIKSISTTICTNASALKYTGTIHIKSSKTRGNSASDDITSETFASPGVNAFSIDVPEGHSSAYLFTSAGLRLDNLTIEYGSQTISDYCTAIAPFRLNLNGSGYATFSCGYPVQIENANAYTAQVDAEAKTITLTKIEGGKVPANTGVLLYGAENAEVTASYAEAAPAIEGTNDFVASSVAVASGKVAWVLNGSSFKKYTGALSPSKAYLAMDESFTVPSSAAAMRIVFGEATAIKTVEAATNNSVRYNLAGQRVNANAKGIIVVNGKKVLNK